MFTGGGGGVCVTDCDDLDSGQARYQVQTQLVYSIPAGTEETCKPYNSNSTYINLFQP